MRTLICIAAVSMLMCGSAIAQENAACDAACPVPCYFGSCAPADAGYKRALGGCDVRALDLIAELYRGTRSASDAASAADILRSQGYGSVGRIGVTPNQPTETPGLENCTSLVEGDTGPCSVVASRPGYRCEVENGVAVLIPEDETFIPQGATEETYNPCRDFRGTPPTGARCIVENGSAVWISTKTSQESAQSSVSRSAFGISADKWISGTLGSAGSTFREFPGGPEMVVIPDGSFTMGSSVDETSREGVPEKFASRERPQRSVRIATFALSRHEVTVSDFRRFVSTTGHDIGDSCWVYDGEWKEGSGRNWQRPGFVQDDEHPVVCVNWNDAQAYLRWLNGKTSGAPYRLASEAEWEYSARAGTTTARYWGDDRARDQACRHANVSDRSWVREHRFSDSFENTFQCDDGYGWTSPVGRFLGNSFGLRDMLGNVWEWTQDCFSEDLSMIPSDGQASTTLGCSLRVLRGGSWINFPWFLRAAFRGGNEPGIRNNLAGFRVARTLTP